jgi:hypothetical protein
MEIKEWIDERLEGTYPSPINALTAAFQITIQQVLSLDLTKRIHEEPLTGFLFGAFATLAPVCSSAFEDEEQDGLSWQYLSKSGPGDLTEPVTGADFALIIEKPGKLARLAIFQAKRESSKQPGTFSVHQVKERRPRKEGAKEPELRPTHKPQFLRLLRHAKGVAIRAGTPSELTDLHWTHYLIYSPEILQCVSVSQLGLVKKIYSKKRLGKPYPDPGPIKIGSLTVKKFLDLLVCGADPNCNGENLRGWLEIPDGEVERVRECLIHFTNVVVARHGPNPELNNDPASGQPSSPDAIAAQALGNSPQQNGPAAHISPLDPPAGEQMAPGPRGHRRKPR